MVGSPAGHAAPFGNGITPQVEANTHNGAGQEHGEHHERADQQVQEGIEDGAAQMQKKILLQI